MKWYINWKLVRQIKDLIRQYIGYVDNEKVRVDLLNKLDGVAEEPKEHALSATYFQLISSTINIFNTGRNHPWSEFTGTVSFQWFKHEDSCWRHKSMFRVYLKYGEWTIAENTLEVYNYEQMSDHQAYENLFEKLFSTMTGYGLHNLIDMYKQGRRYDKALDVQEWDKLRQARQQELYRKNRQLERKLKYVIEDKAPLSHAEMFKPIRERSTYTAATLPSDKDEDFKNYLSKPKFSVPKPLTVEEFANMQNHFVREGDPVPEAIYVPRNAATLPSDKDEDFKKYLSDAPLWKF